MRPPDIKRAQVSKRGNEDILCEIFRIMQVVHEIPEKGEDSRLMPNDQLPKRFHVSGQGPLNGIQIVRHPRFATKWLSARRPGWSWLALSSPHFSLRSTMTHYTAQAIKGSVKSVRIIPDGIT